MQTQTPKAHIFTFLSQVTYSLYRMAAIFDRMTAILDFWVVIMP